MGNFWVMPLLHSVSDMFTLLLKQHHTATSLLYYTIAAVCTSWAVHTHTHTQPYHRFIHSDTYCWRLLPGKVISVLYITWLYTIYIPFWSYTEAAVCVHKPRKYNRDVSLTCGVIFAGMCIYRLFRRECARLRENVPYVKVHRYNPKHLYPKLNGYGDNGETSLKVWQLLHTYWLPNTYQNCQEYVVSVMLISVINI